MRFVTLNKIYESNTASHTKQINDLNTNVITTFVHCIKCLAATIHHANM